MAPAAALLSCSSGGGPRGEVGGGGGGGSQASSAEQGKAAATAAQEVPPSAGLPCLPTYVRRHQARRQHVAHRVDVAAKHPNQAHKQHCAWRGDEHTREHAGHVSGTGFAAAATAQGWQRLEAEAIATCGPAAAATTPRLLACCHVAVPADGALEVDQEDGGLLQAVQRPGRGIMGRVEWGWWAPQTASCSAAPEERLPLLPYHRQQQTF